VGFAAFDGTKACAFQPWDEVPYAEFRRVDEGYVSTFNAVDYEHESTVQIQRDEHVSLELPPHLLSEEAAVCAERSGQEAARRDHLRSCQGHRSASARPRNHAGPRASVRVGSPADGSESGSRAVQGRKLPNTPTRVPASAPASEPLDPELLLQLGGQRIVFDHPPLHRNAEQTVNRAYVYKPGSVDGSSF